MTRADLCPKRHYAARLHANAMSREDMRRAIGDLCVNRGNTFRTDERPQWKRILDESGLL